VIIFATRIRHPQALRDQGLAPAQAVDAVRRMLVARVTNSTT
jgi:hypothetical protein